MKIKKKRNELLLCLWVFSRCALYAVPYKVEYEIFNDLTCFPLPKYESVQMRNYYFYYKFILRMFLGKHLWEIQKVQDIDKCKLVCLSDKKIKED